MHSSKQRRLEITARQKTISISRRLTGALVTAIAGGFVLLTPLWSLAAQGQNKSLAGCPQPKPALRIAGHFNEEFTPHPAENRFASIFFTRLHQMPLFGADPQEINVDAAYGAAQSWEFLPGARGLMVTLRDGLTFNNGDPVTAEDVVFSINLASSDFAEDQIKATLRGVKVNAQVVEPRRIRIEFGKGAPTFVHEMSPLVFPIYVTSRKYHSDGVISQEAFDRFRKNPLATGPYRVIDRQAQRFITLEAARKDPLLGCPVYSRIEIRKPAGVRHAARSVPHGTARYHSRQPRSSEPGGRDRRPSGHQTRRSHDRPVFLSDLAQAQRFS